MTSLTPRWTFDPPPFTAPFTATGMALESDTHALLFDGEKGISRWSLRDGTYERSVLPSDDATPWRHLACSPARDLFAAAQSSSALRVFERATGVERDPKLPGETWCAAFSGDGRRLLAGGLKTVHEIELGAETPRVRKVAGHVHIVSTVGYLPDGLHAFSADAHAVKRIELASGRAVTLAGATAASRAQMHPIEGTSLVAMVGDAISLWDLADDVERARWPLPVGGAWRIVGGDARGPTLALASWKHPRLVLFDLSTGGTRAMDIGWSAPVCALHSRDGASLVVLAASSNVRATGRALFVVDFASGALRCGPAHHGSAALALACSDSPPRVWCASADQRVYAHRLDDGAVVGQCALPGDALGLSVRASGGAPRAVLREDGHYALHDVSDGAVVARVPLRDETDGTWVLDADHATLTAGFHNLVLARVRLSDGREALRFAPPSSAGHGLLRSPDGRHLLRVGTAATDVWRTDDGTLERTLKLAPRGFTDAIAFTPDSATLIFPTTKGEMVLYDFAKGRVRARLPAAADVRDALGCTALCVDPRGRFFFASYWTRTGAVFDAWSLANAAPCARIEWPLAGRARPSAMALSVDGEHLVAGTSSGAMACWDVSQIVV
jgi:WD40 repeat protein